MRRQRALARTIRNPRNDRIMNKYSAIVCSLWACGDGEMRALHACISGMRYAWSPSVTAKMGRALYATPVRVRTGAACRRLSVLQVDYLSCKMYSGFSSTVTASFSPPMKAMDRALIPIAPIYAHGVVDVHVDGLAAALGGAFQPTLHGCPPGGSAGYYSEVDRTSRSNGSECKFEAIKICTG